MILLTALLACDGDSGDSAAPTWECVITEEDPDFSTQLGCIEDFQKLASEPLDASIPGARSVKTVVDRSDDHNLYFQNSKRYMIHWEFASEHLSGDGLPPVLDLATFNGIEYTSPDRRFILGALTYYEEPAIWAWELSPYDTASAEMIETAYDQIRENSFIGDDLCFHPTSVAIDKVAAELPDDVCIVTTDELFAGITYQPLNLGTSMGMLRFYSADELHTTIPNFREIVVLDAVPNDISVVMGIITDQFQTPLAHINVLSQNRGTPNMAYRGAWTSPEMHDLEGKWVKLTVEAQDWSIEEVTQAEADEWWAENAPDPIDVGPMDTSVTALTPTEDIIDPETEDLGEAISAKVPIFGGKATHFGSMSTDDSIPMPGGFAVPVYWYDKFMRDNGFWDEVEALHQDDEFLGDAVVRDGALRRLRSDMRRAPMDPEFVEMVTDHLNENYPGIRMRFRSSTNAEDVSDFNGAGLYTSQSADPNDPERTIEDAVREVWASCWSFRAYEERSYYSIDHMNIGMAMLVHRSFPDEEANGVAITANIFDTTGMEPAFYVNVQVGDNSVVLPDPGVTTDRYLHYYTQAGSPVVYLGSSSLVEDGETVLTAAEIHELGTALQAIHDHFFEVYGTRSFYGMDVEFKFDEGELFIKQARPYPGWNG
ncbi:MAG: hypothetical protein GY913_30335 [Proteobacteria bacterium]|nr:hypothetical protein [Pseudomonadota bacterium]MCP4921217.1 hypothetical protein [Pseudomonadota bacterium]